LKDTNGLVNGVYDLRFTLYPSQAGGNQLGSILYENTSITNGWFTLKVDFGRAVNERWLEIAVRPSGSTEPYSAVSPRQKLTA
jgi:hypothetical protein